ncbi:hypothetical protein [Nocardioides aquiterrae]|uniref:Uncharacterized protein n=1 Tax=Nocardioides aquiterrae TaxID=203799 RepID=A0ABP4FG39_9ACTN
MTENQERPTTNKPLYGPERPKWWPLLAVVGLVVVLVAIFLLVTWVQQNH